jgi:hypothetical protein
MVFAVNSHFMLAETSSDKDHYRRSSLCLILLTHRDKHYAAEMERVFKNFPLPARYNEHNIRELRVISVSGKQSKSDIDRLIAQHDVAKSVVERWFYYSPYSLFMSMNLIHNRGGYGAFYDDYQRSLSNIRGAAMLRDEGIELLQNTFILVCDMDYIDKKKAAAWGAFGMALVGAGLEAVSQVNLMQAQEQYNRGNYSAAQDKLNAAQGWNAGSNLAMAGSAVVADIGGFRVKMKAYLYKLKWNDKLTQTFYQNYWVDKDTPKDLVNVRRNNFKWSRDFQLEYVGSYKTTSSKTILRSWKNEDEVILDVCERCVNKGMRELARSFVVFRPRTPFYFDNGAMYSHIGKKEEVASGQKYEIVQRYKDKKGQIRYKTVGMVQAGVPWDNKNIRFDKYFDTNAKGTKFYCKKSSVDLHSPGLQLREKL